MDNLCTNPVWFWLIALIIFIIFEVATLGLTTIWFALGALAAMAVAITGGPVGFQIAVFVVVTIVTLLGFRKVVLNLFNQNREKTNVESLIGKKGIVIEDISNIHATGQVAVSGSEWTARSVSDGITIEKGEVVVIREISGVKAIVEKEV